MYVLVANVVGNRYFVQQHSDGTWLLSGLIENAKRFESEKGAWKVQSLFSQRNRAVIVEKIN